jgi:hypothetical protein
MKERDGSKPRKPRRAQFILGEQKAEPRKKQDGDLPPGSISRRVAELASAPEISAMV